MPTKLENKAKDIFKWAMTQYNLCEKGLTNSNIYNTPVQQYSIYACHFGENIGNEKNGIGRPVLIVSSPKLLKGNSNVIVIPLSKTIKWQDQGKSRLKYSTHYLLYKSKYTKLNYDSTLQFEDVRTISKVRLGNYICRITDTNDILEIKKRLKEVFSL